MTEQELDKLMEEEIETLSKLAEQFGIVRSCWCTEPPDDYDFNLPFTDKTVIFKNRQGGEIYKLKAPTYLDIWKAFEKSLVDIGPTDHIFIEDIEIIGGTLKIHTGS